ncbi:hypothetical protein WAE58_04860 [Pedobacter panaciterrae]|uniref:Uncharacterized protein n=1 Tax=Pedobacter panaciterrae TaxID=363849 RepID=A0ABU8NHM8_9SPHI
MTVVAKKKRPAKRSWEKTSVPFNEQVVKKKKPEILDFLPPEVIALIENSEHKFSYSEQIMITLFAQIIVEIVLKEDA